MAVITVTEHTRRQAANLKALRERLGLKRSTIASRLGFEGTRGYELYEKARTRLVADQIPVWADAFGITQREFIEEVLLRGASEAYSPRAEMEASGVVPPHRVNQVEADVAGRDESAQRARVAGEIALQHELGPEVDDAPAPAKGRRRRIG